MGNKHLQKWENKIVDALAGTRLAIFSIAD